jgi:RNA polymerase sigma-70 factor (ECF subfamily)
MAEIMTDDELISSYKSGKQESFKDLVEKYTSPLYNFIARLTNKTDADDIVSEVFIKIWKHLDSFDSTKSSFKTWIFTIAKNASTDFLRKKKSLVFSEISDNDKENSNSFAENIPDEALLPDAALQKLQDSSLLNKLIDNLPFHYKTVIILHYQEEMTFIEISRVLGEPLNTVKSRHRRAILELRKKLQS